MRQHNRTWTCRLSSHEPETFQCSRDFEIHLRQYHPEDFSETQLETLRETCFQPGPNPFAEQVRVAQFQEDTNCGLCVFCHFPLSEAMTTAEKTRKHLQNSRSEVLSQVLQDHVVAHLEHIALLALPDADERDSDMENWTVDNTMPEAERIVDQGDDTLPSARFDVEDLLDGVNISREDDIDSDWSFFFENSMCARSQPYCGHVADAKLIAFVQRALDSSESIIETDFYMVIHWLWYSDMNSRMEAIPSAGPNTFHWALDSRADSPGYGLQEWLSNGSGFFLIKGMRGSGKSTFMKFIRSHDETSSRLSAWAKSERVLSVGFAAWASGSELLKCTDGLLRLVLYSILTHFEWKKFKLVLLGLKDASRHRPEPTLHVLKASMELLVRILEAQGIMVCLFVDGLDEFDRPEQVLDILGDFVAVPSLKVCVSSRRPAFNHALASVPSLTLEDHTKDDIRSYVHTRLQKSSFRVLKKLEPLAGRVIEKACGSFLWVSMIMSALESSIKIGDTLETLVGDLNSMPGELERIYRRDFERLDPSFSSETKQIFKLLLVMPKSPSLLTLFLTFNPSLLEPAAKLHHVRLFAVTWLETRSGDLLALRQEKAMLTGSFRAEFIGAMFPILHTLEANQLAASVVFIHHTVREFLDAEELPDPPYVQVLLAALVQIRLFVETAEPGPVDLLSTAVDDFFYVLSIIPDHLQADCVPVFDELELVLLDHSRSTGQHPKSDVAERFSVIFPNRKRRIYPRCLREEVPFRTLHEHKIRWIIDPDDQDSAIIFTRMSNSQFAQMSKLDFLSMAASTAKEVQSEAASTKKS